MVLICFFGMCGEGGDLEFTITKHPSFCKKGGSVYCSGPKWTLLNVNVRKKTQECSFHGFTNGMFMMCPMENMKQPSAGRMSSKKNSLFENKLLPFLN